MKKVFFIASLFLLTLSFASCEGPVLGRKGDIKGSWILKGNLHGYAELRSDGTFSHYELESLSGYWFDCPINKDSVKWVLAETYRYEYSENPDIGGFLTVSGALNENLYVKWEDANHIILSGRPDFSYIEL